MYFQKGILAMRKDLLVIILLIIQLSAAPKLTIVLVIDQFAAHYLPKLDPYLDHGINHLLKNGIVYTNAQLPYSATSTAVGHASLGTGTLPKHHGIVYNKWLNANGDTIRAEEGNCADNVMVPTLNAPFLAKNKKNKSLAISLKSRAAIGLAGKSAPAIWLNEETGQFETNSNSFQIDHLIRGVNQQIEDLPYIWKPLYTDPDYYQFPNINNYNYSSALSIIGRQQQPTEKLKQIQRFTQIPDANEILLGMAIKYIKQVYPNLEDGNLLVWVSLSSLDKIGHIYGPHSKEIIDMIYQLDQQIGEFVNNIAEIAPSNNTMYVLTADHGVMAIPELIKQQYPSAQRLDEQEVVTKVNEQVRKKTGIKEAIALYKTPHLFLNKKLIKKLKPEKKQNLIEIIKNELKKIPGTLNVYTYDELKQMNPSVGSTTWLLQNNIYPDRSGDLMLEIAPYTLISKYDGGTKHNTPYSYNTHVPLILYQKGTHEHKIFPERVWMPQITATLAKIQGLGSISQKALPPLPI